MNRRDNALRPNTDPDRSPHFESPLASAAPAANPAGRIPPRMVVFRS